MELTIKGREESYEKYRRSKPTPYISQWKSSYNQKDYFSKMKVDDKHHFQKLPQEHFSVPFKRTRIEGEFFEKITS
jgi:hypothetical protein